MNDVQPEINPQEVPEKIKKPFPLNLVLGIVIGVIFTFLVASTIYFYNKSKQPKVDAIPSNPTNEINSQTNTNSPYKITWLESPQKIANLNVFNQTKQFSDNNAGLTIYFDKVSYYLVANLGDGSQLINVFLPKQEGPGDDSLLLRAIKTPDGQISISKPQNDYELEQISKFLNSTITINSLSFSELQPPENLYLDNLTLAKNYTNNETFDTLKNPILIKLTNFGDLYAVYTPREDINDLFTKTFYLKLKDSTIYQYNQKYGFISDDMKTQITWNENSTTEDQFIDSIHSGGCGGVVGSSIIKNTSSLLNNKIAVATYGEKTIYQIKDTNNPLLKKLYDQYKQTSQFITPAAVENIDQYANAKNNFLYQDYSGDWIIFINQKYAIQAECGKPVIYLYPPKESQIKVQVGAKITKSEPTYPEKGWLVNAKPNGELTYQNQNYPYLFWEGLGNGTYPNYKNKGILVKQKDLATTLYKQLSQLGLNQKESADFMDFWQSKLPTTPYVRLTWLDTADMDNLAPISVNPKPNTKIRIFLEFEGLEKRVNLIPQTLSAPKREGFTLIEWGGLLIN